MLFDFYGDLLTDKQREYYDLYHNEDFSLAEIAEKVGISRQGVHDIIARAEKTLSNIENKTALIHRWNETRKKLYITIKKGENIPLCVSEYFHLR